MNNNSALDDGVQNHEYAISVVIPVYNAADYIGVTLESVLAQDFKDFEIVLVDDCSTDSSRKKIEPYLSENVRYYCEPYNRGGPSIPRNTGVSHARGEYIVLFDSDDIMLPGKLMAVINVFRESPDVGLVCTNFQSIDEQGRLLKEDFLSEYTRFRRKLVAFPDDCFRLSANDAYAELLNANFVGTSSVTVPRRVFEKLGGFDETVTNGDDYDFWLRVAGLYDFVFIDKVFHQYRVQKNSISFRGGRNAMNRIKVLEKQLSKNLTLAEQADLSRKLSSNYYQAGMVEYINGETAAARRFFVKSFQQKSNMPALKRFALSLLPRALVMRIRSMVRQ